MKHPLYLNIYFIIILAFINYGESTSQCLNRTLNFDGSIPLEYVNLPNLYSTNSDFTVEFWFYSSATSNNAPCIRRTLLSIQNPTQGSSFSIDDCNGDLVANWSYGGCTNQSVVLQNSIRNSWNHLSVTRSGSSLLFYINCVAVSPPITTCSLFNINGSILLGLSDPTTSSEYWLGNIDELRFWDFAKSQAEIDESKNCIEQTVSSGLLAYYQFDQGVAGDPAFPANDNSSISSLVDESGNLQNGTLNNFGLIGNTSNFICSNSPLLYPIEANLVITDYATQTNPVSQICSGDALHFCLLDNNNNVLLIDPSIFDVVWQYNNGTGWVDFSQSVISGFCLGVSSGVLSIDCTSNVLGYEDWDIRAKIELQSSQTNNCEYYSDIETLRICCDIDQTTIDVTSNFTGNLFCEGDNVNYNVLLTSALPFLATPAVDVTIDWFYCEGTSSTPLPSFQNITSFSYSDIVSSGTVCFKADITSCNNLKSSSLSTCFNVDPEPVCGSITGSVNTGQMIQISSSPLVYEACPGSSALLSMDNGFMNCNSKWEYSFNSSFTPAFSLGSTNTSANTNTIPNASWPVGATSIFYRAVCDPISIPSGCDPCYSNILEIRLGMFPLNTVISGLNLICVGSSTTLSIPSPNPLYSYEWYCDGVLTSTASSISVNSKTCCEVKTTFGCGSVTSPLHCVDLCKVEAEISCPLAPNICPSIGQPISLSACLSSSDCPGFNLNYNWSYNNGTLVSLNGCNIQHIPAAAGTMYTVTVTDSTSGCSSIASTTIVPCP